MVTCLLGSGVTDHENSFYPQPHPQHHHLVHQCIGIGGGHQHLKFQNYLI